MALTNMTLTNITFSEAPDDVYTVEIKSSDVLKAITCLASALANILIVFVITRYSVMRTRPNLYLANWCICNCIVMFIMPPSINLFGLFEEIDLEYMCVPEQGYYGLLFGNLLFVVIQLLDWYTSNYNRQSCAVRCKQIHLFVIAITWVIIIGVSVASITFCILDWTYPVSMVCFLLGYLLIFIVILVVFILRCVKINIFKEHVEKSKLELITVTSYFICWLPLWIYMYGQMFLHLALPDIFENFSLIAGYSHAWIMLILLFFCDKSFRVHLTKSFPVKKDRNAETMTNKDQITGLL